MNTNAISEPLSQSQSRKEDILQVAIEIMINEGHAHLSMDKVAKKLGISKGNITYHFPNKKVFIQNIFTELMRQSQTDRQIPQDRYVSSLEERLRLKLEREFEILLEPKHDTRVWETLAYSTHDRNVGLAFEKLFDWFLGEFIDVVAPLRPDLDRQELHDLAMFIVSIPRGLLVFLGSARDCDRREELVAMAIDQTMDMVKRWPPPAGEDRQE